MGCSGSKPLIGCSDIKPLIACSDSKLDRLPAVSLCRDRCKYLDHALRHSYALADAHAAYARSLGTFGATLKRFVDGTLQPSDATINGHHPEPRTKSPKPKNPPNHSSSSSSSSNSHIHLHSDSEDDNIDTNNTKIINNISNNHHHNNINNNDSNNNNDNFSSSYDGNHNEYYNPESLASIFDNFMHIRYMQKQPTRSLSFIHQPAYETHYNLSVHTTTESEHNEMFPPPYYSGSEKARPPPPPPPPQPSDSTWDFLNFFDAYELPAVETTHEKKFVRERSDRERLLVEAEQKQSMVSVFDVSEEIDKRSLSSIHGVGRILSLGSSRNWLEDEGSKKKDKLVYSDARFDVAEVMREVDALFQKASESGNEILKLLDVGRFRYYHRNGVYQVKAKILHAIAAAPPPAITAVSPQLQSRVEVSVDRDDSERMIIFSGNVSSALKKLCMWEKKLKNEVKAEEKLCKIHARKCKELKQLISKGADAKKVDSTQNLIKTLSSQLKVALHVIDKISITINKLRDEELWPQINVLILSFLEMWKAMHECYKNQYQAIARLKSLDAIASSWKLDNSNIESIMQLRLELQNWNLTFCNYVYTQNCFLKALNGWLMKCILQDPIDTPDGLAPFSPTRIDAPPAFVITNRWLQALQGISEKEVTNALQGFSGTVNQMFELQRHNLQQSEVASNEMTQRVRILARREQKMQSIILDRERKIADEKETVGLLPGRMAHGSEIDSKISLQLGLQRIFEALERYSQECVQAYKEVSAFAEG